MARKRGKMALYEVMSKARAKQDYAKTVEPLQTQKKPEKVQTPEEVAVPEPQVAVNWRKKPKIVQYNLGRIEFSIPYQLAITAGLAIILLFLLIFRLGQYSSPKKTPAAEPQGNISDAGRTAIPGLASPLSTRTETENAAPVLENRRAAPVSTGNNVIVLARHSAKSQLVPVQEYFNQKGIPTEIVTSGNMYFLQTVERFVGDPTKPGNNGFELKQKISEIGKNYKAPEGYEKFAPNFFNDAFGRKIEN